MRNKNNNTINAFFVTVASISRNKYLPLLFELNIAKKICSSDSLALLHLNLYPPTWLALIKSTNNGI